MLDHQEAPGPPGDPLSVGQVLEGDLEFDRDLVLQLEGAEEAGVRGDAEVGLADRGAAAEAAGRRAGDLEAERLRPAVHGEGALDPAADGRAGRGDDLRGGERR